MKTSVANKDVKMVEKLLEHYFKICPEAKYNFFWATDENGTTYLCADDSTNEEHIKAILYMLSGMYKTVNIYANRTLFVGFLLGAGYILFMIAFFAIGGR